MAKASGSYCLGLIWVGLCFLTIEGDAAADERLLIERHKVAGVVCAACHDETPDSVVPSSKKCIACHGPLTGLIVRTMHLTPNPHASPHVEPGATQLCTDCHHVHRPSEVTCVQCH